MLPYDPNIQSLVQDMLTMMMKPSDFTDVINVNLNGYFYCAQAGNVTVHLSSLTKMPIYMLIAFMGSMMGQKRGRIINIASIVGQIGNPGQSNYAAAKVYCTLFSTIKS